MSYFAAKRYHVILSWLVMLRCRIPRNPWMFYARILYNCKHVIVIIDKYGMTNWSEGGVTRITINPWKSIMINWNWRKRCPNKLSIWWTNSRDLLKVNFWVVTFFVRNCYKNVSPNLVRLNFQYVRDVIHPKFHHHHILSCPLLQYTLS